MSMTERVRWHEWQRRFAPGIPPIEATISTDELLSELARRGAVTNRGQIKSWQHLGIVPQATRRRHDGATRAIFPPWMVGVLVILCKMRRDGCSLDLIRSVLESQATRIILSNGEEDWRLLLGANVVRTV